MTQTLLVFNFPNVQQHFSDCSGKTVVKETETFMIVSKIKFIDFYSNIKWQVYLETKSESSPDFKMRRAKSWTSVNSPPLQRKMKYAEDISHPTGSLFYDGVLTHFCRKLKARKRKAIHLFSSVAEHDKTFLATVVQGKKNGIWIVLLKNGIVDSEILEFFFRTFSLLKCIKNDTF